MSKAASRLTISWRGLLRLSLALCIVMGSLPQPAHALSRIKDIADFEGVRENQLVGYGLVVGLDGTGDDVKKKAPFTRESLIGMLERLGVKVNQANADLEPKNVAAVMVTATLPAFSRQGSEIDITVSSLGDATSLQGGTLQVATAANAGTARSMRSARARSRSVDSRYRVRRS